MNLAKYQTLVFDCDGVVLNSNKVKTEAFYKAALPYGEGAARQLVDYHVARGGISRYKKFEWFLENVVAANARPDINELLGLYASEVRRGLLSCEIAQGLAELREKTKLSNWLIVSGGDQRELREVFAQRGIAELFDSGIFGSPESKDEILDRELRNGNIKEKAVFLGDSLYDYQASSLVGLDFIFVSKWTEMEGWFSWTEKENINFICSLNDL